MPDDSIAPAMNYDEALHEINNTPWTGEQLRLTVFPTGILAPDDARDWFRTVTGHEAETTTIKRGAELDELGPFDDPASAQIALHVEPTRVDWRLLPRGLDDQGFETLSPLNEVVGRFRTMMSAWLRSSLSLTRIAFGAVLLSPASSQQQGYSSLWPKLPGLHFEASEQFTDFLFQINRQRSSDTVPGLLVNRLSKWSVPQLSVVRVRLSPSQATVSREEPSFAARLELDVNTDATRKEPLPPERMGELFDEMIANGLAIASMGDH